MGKRIGLMVLAIAGLAVAGCGSSSSSSSNNSGSSSSSGSGGAAGLKARTYKVKLAGANEVPKGAPTGSGTAVISIRASSKQLCWKFSNLKNVTAPQLAHIHQGAKGSAGAVVIPLGPGGKYTASGCVTPPPAMLSQIEKAPKGFYVNIHNAKYPGGAVRSQL